MRKHLQQLLLFLILWLVKKSTKELVRLAALLCSPWPALLQSTCCCDQPLLIPDRWIPLAASSELPSVPGAPLKSAPEPSWAPELGAGSGVGVTDTCLCRDDLMRKSGSRRADSGRAAWWKAVRSSCGLMNLNALWQFSADVRGSFTLV